MSVESLNRYAATSQINLAPGTTPVMLVHPQGETATSVTSGPYLAAFAGGSPRCSVCREHDGQNALTAFRDSSVDAGQRSQYNDLRTVRADATSQAAERAARQDAQFQDSMQALSLMDKRTSEAVADFLAAAADLEPESVSSNSRYIQPKKLLGFRLAEGRTEHTSYIKAYTVYHDDSSRDQSESSHQWDDTVYVLPSGQVLFRDGRNRIGVLADHTLLPEVFHPELEKWKFNYSESNVWSRKSYIPGLLPFHFCKSWFLSGTALVPGVPDATDMRICIEECRRTSDEWVRILASYLDKRIAGK